MTTADKLTRLKTDFDDVYNAGYEQGKDDFIGVKWLEVNKQSLPLVVDVRILQSLVLSNVTNATYHRSLFYNMFSNLSPEYGLYTNMQEIYLPDSILIMGESMFLYCKSLTKIHGDLTSCNTICANALLGCGALKELPYFPNLNEIQNGAFRNCTGLTSITFYKVLKTWHTGALTGCTNIETINLVDGWNTAVYVQHCENLTQACLHDMCEKFADMTGKNPLKVYFGETNIEKIDDEHIAMLENKNIDFS